MIKNTIITDVDENKHEGKGNNLYGLSNGLVDVNRDILMKLIQIVYDKCKIRNIIGMTSIFYVWSKKRCFFLLLRPSPLPIRFVDGPGNNEGIVFISGNEISWMKSSYFWGILNEEINSGKYKLVVQCNGRHLDGLGFGVISKSIIGSPKVRSYLYGMFNTNGVCGIVDGAVFLSSRTGYPNFIFNGDFFKGKKKVMLGLEMNADAHTVHFFVNGKQIPHCVTHVPRSVHAAFCSVYSGVSISVQSFAKITVPTLDGSLRCAGYRWI